MHGNFLTMKRTVEIVIVKQKHWKAFLNKRMTDKQFKQKYKKLKYAKTTN